MGICIKRLPAWRIALLGCALLVVFVGGCQSVSSARTHPTPIAMATSTAARPTPTATPLPATFPAFHDWRAVYLAPDMHFHAVTEDGKTDVIGPAFPGFGGQSGGGTLFTAGASPDGHYLAFMNYVTLNVFDMRAQTPPNEVLHSGYKYLPGSMFWSPDSQSVALGEDEFTANSTHVVPIAPITLPHTPFVPGTNTPDTGPYIYPVGWRDNHTLLMYAQIVQSMNPYTATGVLEAMDSSTGATRTITTWSHAERSVPNFVVAPDGQEVFLYNGMAHDQPYIPEAEVIDTATGVVHQQTAILNLEAQQEASVSAAAWQPGTHNLAVTLATDVLVNTATGALTPINSTDFVAGWSPDGSTLVLSNATNDQNGVGFGPFTLTAVTFSPSGQATLEPLTHNSMDFIFLGFIHSA